MARHNVEVEVEVEAEALMDGMESRFGGTRLNKYETQ
jgi:hypothetical protein